jgi:xanthine dehydrogenase accessory factor
VLFEDVLAVVRGGGDLGSGVIYRLVKAGFPVVLLELPQPLVIRRTVAFASAAYDGVVVVEGMTARHVEQVSAVQDSLRAEEIPLLVDEAGESLAALQPAIVVDARIAKRNLGTTLHDAPFVIGLGPGFEAGQDCHAVIETNRGHYLGRVIWHGAAEPDTGKPGSVQGRVSDRVLRAPVDGTLMPLARIGDTLAENQPVASIGNTLVTAPFDGVLRGLIHPSVPVKAGLKIGDVDPRARRDFCFKISEKALAIGGGVLEAILSAPQLGTLLKHAVSSR